MFVRDYVVPPRFLFELAVELICCIVLERLGARSEVDAYHMGERTHVNLSAHEVLEISLWYVHLDLAYGMSCPETCSPTLGSSCALAVGCDQRPWVHCDVVSFLRVCFSRRGPKNARIRLLGGDGTLGNFHVELEKRSGFGVGATQCRSLERGCADSLSCTAVVVSPYSAGDFTEQADIAFAKHEAL